MLKNKIRKKFINVRIVKRKKFWFERDPYARFANKDIYYNPKGRTLYNLVTNRYVFIRFWQNTKWFKEREKKREAAKFKYGLLDPIKSEVKRINVVKFVKKFIRRRFLFKNLFFFMKKLFSMFIKKGLKIKIISYFNYIKVYIKRRFKLKYKKFYFYFYFLQVMNNILPIFNNTNILFKGENKKMPYFTKKKHHLRSCISISCSWIKNSVKNRKEKTLFLKLVSELESIRKSNNSNSVNTKKQYYKDFYDNKYFIKFFRKRNWI